MTTKNIAFVIGNGVSRTNIDISNLNNHGTVYGCNAIYRDQDVDYLVAVDVKMVLEIVKNKYHLRRPVWTNTNRQFKKITGLNFFNPSLGWSSGPTALNFAAEKSHQKIYILGFDFQGLENGEKINNVYSGTKNYKRKDDRAIYYGNWLKQTNTVIQKNQEIFFTRVIDRSGFIPEKIINNKNLDHIFVDEFKEIFNK